MISPENQACDVGFGQVPDVDRPQVPVAGGKLLAHAWPGRVQNPGGARDIEIHIGELADGGQLAQIQGRL